jgi:hypothetical protein
VEFDASAQRERIGLAVLGNLPFVRQHRPDRGVLAERHQAFDHVSHHTVRVAVTVGAGISGADVGVHARPQRAAVGIGGQSGEVAEGQRQAGREAERVLSGTSHSALAIVSLSATARIGVETSSR